MKLISQKTSRTFAAIFRWTALLINFTLIAVWIATLYTPITFSFVAGRRAIAIAPSYGAFAASTKVTRPGVKWESLHYTGQVPESSRIYGASFEGTVSWNPTDPSLTEFLRNDKWP